jgi:release factor glutamine methyltransferase
MRSGLPEAALTALEVGTGTGAIALSLLREGPFRLVVATDISPGALSLAEENAGALGLSDRLQLRGGRGFEPVASDERFDVIVSNPPYVASGDLEGLAPEVRDWEPTGALLAGEAGLDVLVPLAREAWPFLRAGGLLALELGVGQASEMERILLDTGAFRDLRITRDLAGKERIVLGIRT